jgi:CRP-like cAMP-binding protein
MVPVSSSDSPRNELIQSLPRGERDRLLRSCKPCELNFGQILCDADESYRHAYFPVSGSISLMSPLEGHSPMEMGLIGSEGMLGATLALGVDIAPTRAFVQGPGMALRISAAKFRRELRDSGRLRHVLGRYLFLRIAQLLQMGPCTRFHQIEPRLARWLLMTHDRAQSDHFRLTHLYLAEMLGVRRSGVTVAAGALQARKLIHYARGEITILDRAGLEAASCTCYASMQVRQSRQNGSS